MSTAEVWSKGCDLLQVVNQVWRDERFRCSEVDPKVGEANMHAANWHDLTVLPR